jgi:hypothetical protein
VVGLVCPGLVPLPTGPISNDIRRRLVSLHMTIATPRATSRITAFLTAGLLALGSQHPATFPVSQWCLGLQLTDYSCGGSRGLRAHAFRGE